MYKSNQQNDEVAQELKLNKLYKTYAHVYIKLENKVETRQGKK